MEAGGAKVGRAVLKSRSGSLTKPKAPEWNASQARPKFTPWCGNHAVISFSDHPDG